MATLLSPSHLFNSLHVHPCGVRRRRWQWQLVVCMPHTGDPPGQEHPNSLWPEGCCAASSCSPSPGDWCGSCWSGTAQVTPTAHHKHPQGFGQAVTSRLFHGLNKWSVWPRCGPTSFILPYHSLQFHGNLRFGYSVAGHPVRTNTLCTVSRILKSLSKITQAKLLGGWFFFSSATFSVTSIGPAGHHVSGRTLSCVSTTWMGVGQQGRDTGSLQLG